MGLGSKLARRGADPTPASLIEVRPLVAQFTNKALELEFRESQHDEDRRVITTVLVAGSLTYLAFWIGDIVALGFTNVAWMILIARLGFVLPCLVIAVGAHRGVRVIEAHWPTCAVGVLAFGSLGYVASQRPDQAGLYNVGACVLLIAAFIFLPSVFVSSVVASVAGLALFMVLAPVAEGQDLAIWIQISAELVCVLGMGAFAQNRIEVDRRERWALVRSERTASAELMEEISRRQRLEDELSYLATYDDLTRLLNRRAFLGDALMRFDLAQQTGAPMVVMLIDADHFKAINDRHGHHVGDEVLRYLSTCCRAEVRSLDVLGRLGGEEFAILAPGATVEVGSAMASRIRARIAAMPAAVVAGTPVPVTVSIGVAEVQVGRETLHDALRRADHAMYEAKSSGRDRVSIAAAVI